MMYLVPETAIIDTENNKTLKEVQQSLSLSNQHSNQWKQSEIDDEDIMNI